MSEPAINSEVVRREWPLSLGVNIDHIATLRQARYALDGESENCEPDVLLAAATCLRAGASGITVHLRGDRRHMQDRDIFRLRSELEMKMNLEMGNTAEMVEIALGVRPEEVCLVPENREEVTTEGGLEVAGQMGVLRRTVERLQGSGILVSLFIEPELGQIAAAGELGVAMVELHTGAFSNARGGALVAERERLERGAKFAADLGMRVNAGHGINYRNVGMVRGIGEIRELNIGHAIISRAVVVGLEVAVGEMLGLMRGEG